MRGKNLAFNDVVVVLKSDYTIATEKQNKSISK